MTDAEIKEYVNKRILLVLDALGPSYAYGETAYGAKVTHGDVYVAIERIKDSLFED